MWNHTYNEWLTRSIGAIVLIEADDIMVKTYSTVNYGSYNFKAAEYKFREA